MIEHLTGTILDKGEEHVVLEVGGVGYGLDVPAPTASSLGGLGSEASLWVQTYVTETDLSLYGFRTRGERDLFEVCLGISGVGPRLGLAILSTFTAEDLIRIVMNGDAQTLKQVPGIGLKKAEKLLLELKGRVDRLAEGIEPSRRAELGRPGSLQRPLLATEPAREAAAALEALDIQPSASRRAVSRALEILGPDAGVEDLVREGLRHRRAV